MLFVLSNPNWAHNVLSLPNLALHVFSQTFLGFLVLVSDASIINLELGALKKFRIICDLPVESRIKSMAGRDLGEFEVLCVILFPAMVDLASRSEVYIEARDGDVVVDHDHWLGLLRRFSTILKVNLRLGVLPLKFWLKARFVRLFSNCGSWLSLCWSKVLLFCEMFEIIVRAF